MQNETFFKVIFTYPVLLRYKLIFLELIFLEQVLIFPVDVKVMIF
jgi:hypothetical protein